ncbi:MAG: type II toxin-antitoxin system PemK/MazF family toxin [Bryobacteraceae bacterium]
MDPKQGEIYWVEIRQSETVGTEQWKRRPYIIVSRTAINKVAPNVVGVPMSTQTRKAGQHRILLPATEIIRDVSCASTISDSVALTDQIRVLDKSRLETRIGCLTQTATVGLLENGLAFLFDIPV